MIMARKDSANPRKQPQQDRSKVTVEAILQATAHILTEEGYDKVSTNRVAEVAGVSIGSLYQYFPNKESLIAALAQQHTDDMVALVEANLQNIDDEPIPQVLGRIISAAIAAHAVNPDLHRVLNEEVPRRDRRRNLADQKVAGMLRTYLEHNVNRLHPQNLDLTAFILARTVEALTHAAVLDYPELLATQGELEQEITMMLAKYLVKS
jgi:AcrR family transcriptional regulator